ncbi:MAG: VOC family protein [Comamonas sp.]|jgi:predicted enzyme related to lactoylglutathione lyase|uniref:VOC family protein n=1 Tax=Comamonas sp. TaxID=34028 RepID=UPI00282F5E41|nr:VOC family protein [Comamonas sp.]MDR0213863.1 VOC family protein [Comamonas sp.]
MLLKQLESVLLFVSDIEEAATWYAEIFETKVHHENEHYAFIKTTTCLIGFHPLDHKCPGGPGGACTYWEVADLDAAISALQRKGAALYRGPITTSLGARAAMLLDPFGCTLGLNQASAQSLDAINDLMA